MMQKKYWLDVWQPKAVKNNAACVYMPNMGRENY
jgi:hypothetical protein